MATTATTMKLLVSLLFSLFLLSSVCARTIVFDSTQEDNCIALGGCSFFNASIWINGTVPTLGNDDVVINGTHPAALVTIYFPSNSSLMMGFLSISNATFLMQANSTLNVAGVTLGESSSFHSEFNSLFVTEDIVMDYHGTPSAEWDIYGNVTANGNVYLFGDFKVKQGAYVDFNYVFYYPNPATIDGIFKVMNLDIPHYASVTLPGNIIIVSSIILELNSVVTVTDPSFYTPQLYLSSNSTIQFTGVDVTIGSNHTQSLAGNGIIQTSKSNLTIISEHPATFDGSIVISFGNVNIVNLELSNLQMDIGYTNTLVGDGLTLTGNSWTSLGGIAYAVGNGINITNGHTLAASGGIVIGTYLSVGSNNSILSSLDYNIVFAPNAKLILEGGIIAPSKVPFYIPQNGTLVILQNSTIENDLVLEGTLVGSSEHYVNIGGNLTLGANSTLNVRVSKEGYPIFVIGNVIINGGKIDYEIKEHYTKNRELVVISALYSSKISGTFNSPSAVATSHSLVERDLPIKIGSDTVYLEYTFKLKDVQTWIWVVTGIAVAVSIFIVIFVITMCVRRRRHDYKPVR